MALFEKLKQNLTGIKISLLICLLGTGSWVEINGIWVELPLLVSQSPQQWSLPSYLTVVIQLANIGPILYVIANRYIKKNGRKVVTEVPVIYTILCVGLVASFLLAFLWKETTIISGVTYSTALIVLSFFLATVDCTSSLTFLPFMAYFPAKYMTAYYVGEGFSGFLPSILALIQGVGEKSYTCKQQTVLQNITVKSVNNHPSFNETLIQLKNVTETVPSYFSTEPRFSVQVFFLFISAMMLSSLLSFAGLVYIKRREVVSSLDTKSGNEGKDYETFSMKQNDVVTKNKEGGDLLNDDSHEDSGLNKRVIYLLVVNALINGLSNGALPALQSYACLPYSFEIYHLTLVLSAFANPLACFLYFFVSLESIFGITIGVLVYLASAGYTIGMAAMSPCPVLNGSSAGGIVVVS